MNVYEIWKKNNIFLREVSFFGHIVSTLLVCGG